MAKLKFILCAFLMSFSAVVIAEGNDPLDSLSKQEGFQMDLGKDPTYIKSKSLTLRADERVFVYSGNVDVIHGDLHMTCDEVEGHYTEDNQISKMTARKNIVIVKGDSIRATCQKAIYEQKNETLTLTENPELLQNGSVLSADSIIIHMQTNKSEATGNVRVKLVQQEGNNKKIRNKTK